MKLAMRNVFGRVAFFLSLSMVIGCRSGNVAPIPSHVTAEEMAVYTDWLQSYQKANRAQKIETFPTINPIPSNGVARTAAFDPIERDREVLQADGANVAAYDELAALGDASYSLKEPFDPKLATFASTCAGLNHDEKTGTKGEIALVRFSRVVFSRDGKTAFLHVGHGITRGQIHNGFQSGYVVATKSGDGWSFRYVGPRGIS